MASYRKERLEELIKRIIGDLLIKGVIKDPRIGFATVVKAELNDDRTIATVHISVIGGADEKRKTIKGLNAAAGFVKFHLGKEMQIKTIPDVTFVYDDSIEKGLGVVNLIDGLAKEKTSEDE